VSAITTHVLDTSLGRPATGVPVTLERSRGEHGWELLGQGENDADGRLRTLLPSGQPLVAGRYRLIFDTRRYFDNRGVRAFYPTVIVTFDAAAGEPHYHLPLLLSPFGYSTYRGS
jgi:5-hydroxyisourate hydrolase